MNDLCQHNDYLDYLSKGIDPPEHRLDKDYIQMPSNPRNCVQCGARHDLCLEDTRTGERIEEFDLCKNCFFKKHFKFNPINEQIKLDP